MDAVKFFIWWLAIFAGSYLVLSLTGFVPAEISDFNSVVMASVAGQPAVAASAGPSPAPQSGAQATSTPRVSEKILPDRIIIDKIGVDDPVVNPETRDAGTLDAALMQGVVRYPGSGGLDDNTNMFLFGHSTSFKTVYHQAYKSFNNLGQLQLGDIIRIESGGTEYQYSVTSVQLVDQNEALVNFESGKKMVTLSTCDTFGQKSDRFVVQAVFVKSLPIN